VWLDPSITPSELYKTDDDDNDENDDNNSNNNNNNIATTHSLSATDWSL
jgi:hypothetical protein